MRHNVAGGRIGVVTTTVDGRPRLAVESTGAAIRPGYVDRLFEPFQRLDGRTGQGPGHGLGLAIVRAIAAAHGAVLVPTARPERGLIVEVTFPAPADPYT